MHLVAKCKLVPHHVPRKRKLRLLRLHSLREQKLELSLTWGNISSMEGFFLADKPDPNKKLREVPHKPGVYLMKDRLKRVIYVGKARDLRKRLSQYFMPSRRLTG